MKENRFFADAPAPDPPGAPQMPPTPESPSQAFPGAGAWQFEPPKPREPIPAAPLDGGLALALYLAAWFFLRFCWQGWLGLGMLLFTAAFAGAALVYRRWGGASVPRKSLPWLGVMLLSAASFPVLDNGLIAWLNLLFLAAVTVYWVAALEETRVEDRLGDCLAADLTNQLCIIPFQNFDCWGTVVKNTFAKTTLGKNLFIGGLSLLCFLPVLWFVCAQLASVAAGFGEVLWQLGDLVRIENLLSPITLLAIPTAFYLFGLLYGCRHKRYTSAFTPEKLAEAAKRRKLLPPAAAYTLLAVLCLIYTLFFVIGAAELITFTRRGALAPQDYSRFAREGFFELCRVSVVNLLVLLGTRLFLNDSSQRSSAPTRIFHSLLCCQTLLLIALALCKMGLYIRCCGVTWLRVSTTWFMALLAVVFGLLLLSQFREIPLTRWTAAAFCALFLVLCWMNVDALVVKNAIWRYESLGDASAISSFALRSHAVAGAPDLYALWQRESLREDSPVLPELQRLLTETGERTDSPEYSGSFSQWNLQRARAYRLTYEFLSAQKHEAARVSGTS